MSITKYAGALGIIYEDAYLWLPSAPLVLRLYPLPVESDKLVEEVVVLRKIVRMLDYFFKLLQNCETGEPSENPVDYQSARDPHESPSGSDVHLMRSSLT